MAARKAANTTNKSATKSAASGKSSSTAIPKSDAKAKSGAKSGTKAKSTGKAKPAAKASTTEKDGKPTIAGKTAAGKTTAARSSRKRTAPATPPSARSKDGATPDLQPQILLTHDQIAARAYAIWEAKGKPRGEDAWIWKEAERALWAEARS